MAITDLNGYIGGIKSTAIISKNNSVTTVGGLPSGLFDRAGQPGSLGQNHPNNVVSGIVPVAGNAGYPALNAVQGSNKLYLSRVEAQWNVAGALALYDVLFAVGQTTIPTAGTTTVNLSGQPSFAGRVPNNSAGTPDYRQCELWAYVSTAWSNHAHSLNVTYVDDAGNSPETTANLSTQNVILNRLVRVPLNAGDAGVRQINSYALNGIASAAGTVSLFVMRRLWMGRVNFSESFSLDRTGMPELFPTSALQLVAIPDSTSSALPSVQLELTEG